MRPRVDPTFIRTMHRFCALLSLGAACSSAPVVASPAASPVTLAETAAPPSSDLYRDAGFIVGNGSIPFVGQARFTATEFLDSTAVLVSLSIPPRTLSFVRAGDRYAAFYAIRVDLQRGGTITRSDRLTGEVRVASFAETNRGDEGVLFQRSIRVAPGTYELRITASDSLGTGTGVAAIPLVVPVMADGALSSLIPVFLAEPRATRGAALAIVANPAATARYGRDTALFMYLEAYGTTAPDSVTVLVRDDDPDGIRYADSVAIPAGERVRVVEMSIPAAQLKLGRNTILVLRGGATVDSLSAVLTLGVDLPIAATDELPDVLRYFASEAELRGLRGASVQARPAQWAALVHKTDPNPATPENEMLQEYARRLRLANALYREGTQAGWKTPRGSVLSALGEPDAVSEALPDPVSGARIMNWEYRRHRLTLVFTDTSGSGLWKLTPASDSDFRTLVAFSGPCVGCR